MYRPPATGATSNMPTEAFRQPASGVQHQLEDQQGRLRLQGTHCRSRQEGRAGPFGEVCELHTIACRGPCKITFRFPIVSNHSGSDRYSYN